MAILSSETLHATSVSIGGRCILIDGVSGAGKSDLALRLIDRGAVLVSDDYTIIQRREGQIIASAPATIAGQIEIRGLGILQMPYAGETPVTLVVALGEPSARMPEPERMRNLLGVNVALVSLDGFTASAAIKVELAAAHPGLAV